MPVKVEIEISPKSLARLQKMLRNATPEMLDEVEIEWNNEGLRWNNFFKKEHLSGKPLQRSSFGKAKYRNPATPENVLTRISSNLFNSMLFVVKRPKGDVVLKSGFGIPGTDFVDVVKDYAPVHRKRMEIDKEFKAWSPKFVKAARKGVDRAIRKVNR